MDAYIGFYGARNPADAAGVYFQKGEVYEQQGKHEALRGHLTGYLERWGKHGGVDRQVQAHFRLGEIAWKASCARPSGDGACLHVDRMTATRSRRVIEAANRKLGTARRTQCGPATKSKITVFDRSRQQAAGPRSTSARRSSCGTRATRCGSRSPGATPRRARAQAAYAAAGRGVPPRRAALRGSAAHQVSAEPGLLPAVGARQPATARRRTEEAGRFAQAVRRVPGRQGEGAGRGAQPLPGGVQAAPGAVDDRGGGARRPAVPGLRRPALHRRDPEGPAGGRRVGRPPARRLLLRLEEEAEKVEAKAIEALRSCLTAATSESWYNQWSRLCEQELSQLQPGQFPVAAEVKPEPTFAPTVFIAAPLCRPSASERRGDGQRGARQRRSAASPAAAHDR